MPEQPPEAPTSLWKIIERLLHKEPDERYQSASGLARDLKTWLERLELGDERPFTLGTQDKSTLNPPFTARQKERRLLQNCQEAAAKGNLQVVLLSGPSGIGKSRLVEEVCGDWTSSTILRASGRAYGQKSALGVMADALSSLLEQGLSSEQIAHIRNAVGDLGQGLIELGPALSSWLAPPAPNFSDLDPERRRNVLFQVMNRMIEALSDNARPVILFIDDLQWADAGSLEMLDSILKSQSNLLAILSFRDNEISRSDASVIG